VSAGLIDSTEMYLRTILELEEEGIPPLRARLTERLGLSAPSVSQGVGRLVDEGYVRLGPDRRIELTGSGRERAVHVLRKHRLAERLLVDVLGLEHEYVHEEACRWEHVISDRVEQKLVEFLGNPATSPYGNPIPGSRARAYDPLTLADSTGERVRVERLSERLQADASLIHALDAAGIGPGEEVTVDRRADGVEVTGAEGAVVVGEDAARSLYVSELVSS
jgi:DtxR family Mn-dependent transcriptional regulator